MTGTPLLEVEHLSKDFPIRGTGKAVHACDDVTFEVAAGQTIGVIGESGSGKTTLGRCIVRLIEPSAGSIRIDGADLSGAGRTEVRRLRAQMQIVFQEPLESFNPSLRLGSQIGLPLRALSHLKRSARETKVAQLLDQVGLSRSIADALPGAVPAGVLQKCSIARAIATGPRLLILDEPTSALAPEAEAEIMALLARLQDELQLAYVFISHDLSLVRSFCDSVAVMYLGQIVELGPQADVYASPAHPYTRALLASVLQLDPRQRQERAQRSVPLAGEVPSPIDLPSGCYLESRCRHRDPRCAAERQDLTQLEGGRSVRCWRAASGTLPPV